jgi:hypothetical protein
MQGRGGMTRTFDNLRVCSLNPEQHERTCGYWYTVTSGAMAHTAFATRAGLDRWLEERGLELASDLPAQGEFGVSAIVGKYHERSHLDVDEFNAVRPVLATAVLSNGEYTLALIENIVGTRTVHYLNPNVKDRLVFDYKQTRELMS